jgi:hypothetical protein
MKTGFLSLLTIIAAIPSLGFVIFFMRVYDAPLTHWFIMENLVIVFSCFIGGVLLWKGKKWGYRVSEIGWLIILYRSFMSIYVAFLPDTKEVTRVPMFITNAIFIVVGITVLIALIGDIVKRKHV